MLGFRVWNKELNKFESRKFFMDSDSGVYAYWCNKEMSIFTFDNTDENCEYIPMQSTGQKDSNGILIYEGDVIKWDDNFYLYVRKVREFYINMSRLKYPTGFVVVGNVYESPELLGEMKC